VNSVHDMGGMHGLGPIVTEPDEPVFHAPWEARAFALNLAAFGWGRWTLDGRRHQFESILGPDYLRMSYYEIWMTGLVELLIKTKLVTLQEIDTGRPAPGLSKATPSLIAEYVPAILGVGGPTKRAIAAVAQFSIGDRVRARNINPIGHTRLPRYVRGHCGSVTARHGAHVFPDTNAHGLGEQPQHLYQVRFEARELWGTSVDQRSAVYLDLWESYLEPV
jgi:nitrile hydratase subunit beta